MTPQAAAEAEQAAVQQAIKVAMGEMQFQLVILSTQLQQARTTIATLEAQLAGKTETA
jgi:hypothetical protein